MPLTDRMTEIEEVLVSAARFCALKENIQLATQLWRLVDAVRLLTAHRHEET